MCARLVTARGPEIDRVSSRASRARTPGQTRYRIYLLTRSGSGARRQLIRTYDIVCSLSRFCLSAHSKLTSRGKSGPALGGISIPRESCTNAKAKYSSSVVPPDLSVHFYHCSQARCTASPCSAAYIRRQRGTVPVHKPSHAAAAIIDRNLPYPPGPQQQFRSTPCSAR